MKKEKKKKTNNIKVADNYSCLEEHGSLRSDLRVKLFNGTHKSN